MKYCSGIFIFVLVFLPGVFSPLRAQPTNWLWAKSGGGKGNDQATSIAVDGAGNSYVAGSFSDSAVFSGQTIRSSRGNHLFIAKYSSSGTLAWIHTTGLNGPSYAQGIAISQGKYIYLTGYFGGTISFDTTTLSCPGTNNIFLAKFDLDGKNQWALSAGGGGSDLANALSLDDSGNIYVTGGFSGNMNFGSVQLTSIGGNDIFLAKYNSDGRVLWAKNFGSPKDDAAYGIAVGNSGNVVITGMYSDTIDFGGTSLLVKATLPGASDIFIAKYTSSGDLLWANAAGDTASSKGSGAVIDNQENIYISGDGDGTSPYCDSAGNIFIAKYNSAGILQWMKCAGIIGGEESGNAIALDSSGNIIVTGEFDFTLDFGTFELLNQGLLDGFIVKFDPSGTALWADRFGSIGTDFGNALAIQQNGDIEFAGLFSDTCLFGPFTLESVRGTDAFVAKIGAVSSVQGIPSASRQISLYPNPSQSEITIKCSNLLKNTQATMEIISVLGVTVKKNILSFSEEQGLEISVRDIPKGIYICRLSGKNWSQSQMLVIQ
jgi:hypothetical protein